MLRVRTGPKALRAIGGSSLNCGIAREKINQPEHTAGGSQNKGTEKLQRRAGPSPLEVGSRGEGKGANSAPEKLPLPSCKQAPGSYLKIPETLDGRHPPPGGSQLESNSSPTPLNKCKPQAHDQRRALGPRKEKARRIRGECAQASGCLSHSPQREKARRIRGEGAQASGSLNR